ncbi:hypothetical protein Btru_002372 [Bulinus truncatus]|nr:hypothetical protein Btru_002372 [Bulinus truncatus]
MYAGVAGSIPAKLAAGREPDKRQEQMEQRRGEHHGDSAERNYAGLCHIQKNCAKEPLFNSSLVNVSECCRDASRSWGVAEDGGACVDCFYAVSFSRPSKPSPAAPVRTCRIGANCAVRTFLGVSYEPCTSCQTTLMEFGKLRVDAWTTCSNDSSNCYKGIRITRDALYELYDDVIVMRRLNQTNPLQTVGFLDSLDQVERIGGKTIDRLIDSPYPEISFDNIGDSVFLAFPSLDLSIRRDSGTEILISVGNNFPLRTEKFIGGVCGMLDTDNYSSVLQKYFVNATIASPTCNQVNQPCDTPSDADSACSILSSGLFSPCHSKVDVRPYVKYCQQIYCSASVSTENDMRCHVVSGYAGACLNEKIQINWREEAGCGRTCPSNFVYRDCGPFCRPACGRPTLTGNVQSECRSCVAGCHCPDGLVNYNRTCIDPSQCPCSLNGLSYSPHESVYVHDTCQNCTCGTRGVWNCSVSSNCYASCFVYGPGALTTFDKQEFLLTSDEVECTFTLVTHPTNGLVINMISKQSPDNPANILPRGVEIRADKVHLIVKFKADRQPEVLDLKKNQSVQMPYSDSVLYVRQPTTSSVAIDAFNFRILLFNLNYLVVATWDSFYEPGTLRGLCGNMNKQIDDDRCLPSGIEAPSDESFIQAYTVNSCGHSGYGRVDYGGAVQTKIQVPDLNYYIDDIQPTRVSVTNLDKIAFASRDLRVIQSTILKISHASQVPLSYLYSQINGFVKLPQVKDMMTCSGDLEQNDRVRVWQTHCLDLQLGARMFTDKTIPGCSCRGGRLLNQDGHCVYRDQCPCLDAKSGRYISPGPFVNDSCFHCNCQDGRLTCNEKGCEEIVCPANQTVYTYSRPSPGACARYRCPDKTGSSVTCLNDPPTDRKCVCRSGFVETTEGLCVPTGMCPCFYNDVWHDHGSYITVRCNINRCNNSQWQKIERTPDCLASCYISGTLMRVVTFDGSSLSFSGHCPYTLMRSSGYDAYVKVSVKNLACGSTGSSCSHQIDIQYKGQNIQLNKELGVLAGNRTYLADRSPELGNFRVFSSTLYTVVSFEDISVYWTGGLFTRIQVSDRWFKKLEGLCGNYDNNSINDLVRPDHSLDSNIRSFVTSWIEDGATCSDSDFDLSTPSCQKHPERATWANSRCGVITTSETFQSCRRAMPQANINRFFSDCKENACSCDRGGDCECLCDSVAFFASSCAAAGFPTKWRRQQLCPVQCEGGMVYQAKGSPCHRTCADLARNVTSCRRTLDVEGCFCPIGLVWNGSNCIPPSDCACYDVTRDNQTGPMPPVDCSDCSCDNGQLLCNGRSCPRCSRNGHVVHSDMCDIPWSTESLTGSNIQTKTRSEDDYNMTTGLTSIVTLRTAFTPTVSTQSETVQTSTPTVSTQIETVQTTSTPTVSTQSETVQTSTPTVSTQIETVQTTSTPTVSTLSETVQTTSTPTVSTQTETLQTTSTPTVSTQSETVQTTSTPTVSTQSETVQTTSTPTVSKQAETLQTTSTPTVSKQTETVQTTSTPTVSTQSETLQTTSTPTVSTQTETLQTTSTPTVSTQTETLQTTSTPTVSTQTETLQTTSTPTVSTLSETVQTTSTPTVSTQTETVQTTSTPTVSTQTETVQTTSTPTVSTQTEIVQTTSTPTVSTQTETLQTTSTPTVSTLSETVQTTSTPTVSTQSETLQTTSTPTVSTLSETVQTTSTPTVSTQTETLQTTSTPTLSIQTETVLTTSTPTVSTQTETLQTTSTPTVSTRTETVQTTSTPTVSTQTETVQTTSTPTVATLSETVHNSSTTSVTVNIASRAVLPVSAENFTSPSVSTITNPVHINVSTKATSTKTSTTSIETTETSTTEKSTSVTKTKETSSGEASTPSIETTETLTEEASTPSIETTETLTEEASTPSNKTTETLTEEASTPSIDTTETLTEEASTPSIETTETLTEEASTPSIETTETLTEEASTPSIETTETLTEEASTPSIETTETSTEEASTPSIERTETLTEEASTPSIETTETLTEEASTPSIERTETSTEEASTPSIERIKTSTEEANAPSIETNETLTEEASTPSIERTETSTEEASALSIETTETLIEEASTISIETKEILTEEASTPSIETTETSTEEASTPSIERTETLTEEASAPSIETTETLTEEASTPSIERTETSTEEASTPSIERIKTSTEEANAPSIETNETLTEEASTPSIERTETSTEEASALSIETTETLIEEASTISIETKEILTEEASTPSIETTETSTEEASTPSIERTETLTEEASAPSIETNEASTKEASAPSIETTETSTTEKSTSVTKTKETSSGEASTPSIETTETLTEEASTPSNKTTETLTEKASTPSIETTETLTEEASTPSIETNETLTEEASTPSIETTETLTEEASTSSIKRTETSTEEASAPSIETTETSTEEASTPSIERTETSTEEASTQSIETSETSTEEAITPSIETTEKTTEEASTPSFETTETLTEEASTPSIETTETLTEEASTSIETTETSTEEASTSIETTETSTEEASTSIETTEKTTEEANTQSIETTETLTEEASTPSIETTETLTEEASTPSIETTETLTEEASTPSIETTETLTEEASTISIERKEILTEEASTPSIETTETSTEEASTSSIERTETLTEEASTPSIETTETSFEEASTPYIETTETSTEEASTSSIERTETLTEEASTPSIETTETSFEEASTPSIETTETSTEEARTPASKNTKPSTQRSTNNSSEPLWSTASYTQNIYKPTEISPTLNTSTTKPSYYHLSTLSHSTGRSETESTVNTVGPNTGESFTLSPYFTTAHSTPAAYMTPNVTVRETIGPVSVASVTYLSLIANSTVMTSINPVTQETTPSSTSCPCERPQVCTPCHRPCEQSCRAYRARVECQKEDQCHEGCQCPPEQFMDDEGHCNPRDQCPCYDARGQEKLYNTTYIDQTSCEICKCTDTGAKCQEMTTVPPDLMTTFDAGHWSQWSDCSALCGAGTSTRHRFWHNQNCYVRQVETKQCNVTDCICITDDGQVLSEGETLAKENCQQCSCQRGQLLCQVDPNITPEIEIWNNWSVWTPCRRNCTHYHQSRCRSCKLAECGDVSCRNGQCETRPCGTQPCCSVFQWSEWSDCGEACSSSDSGVRSRERLYPDQETGSSCPEEVQTKSCDTCQCSEVIGQWSEWTNCTTTSCGWGKRSRQRKVPTSCPDFSSSQSEDCFTKSCDCPGDMVWTNHSNCQRTCQMEPEPGCRLQVYGGCVCPKHLVLDGNRCVPLENCSLDCVYNKKTFQV